MTSKEYLKLQEDADKWISTPEAQEALRKAYKDAQETIAELEYARKVTWQQLHEPMTI